MTLVCGTAWTVAAVAAEHGHEPAPAPPGTNAPTAPAPEVNPSLQESAHFISNSNLVASSFGPQTNSPAQQFEALLKLAQQQHRQKSLAESAKNFAALLEGQAPEEMKRTALLELAVIAQEENQLAKAQQILSQYTKKYWEDTAVPEVLLRQGLLYRQMGAPKLALSKFYSVMTTALTLKRGDLAYYQRLVLHAQTEIADTHYGQGEHVEALEMFTRLLKLESAELKQSQIHFKLIRCLAALGRHPETVAQAGEFLTRYPAAQEEPEVRYLLADTLRQLGRHRDALQQVLLLLKSEKAAAENQPERWVYWQQRTGNDIANQLYQDGSYLDALQIYEALASLSPAPGWQLPAWYQSGLCYERLQQPAKAVEAYQRILARQKDLPSEPEPALKAILEMARWRAEFLDWQSHSGATSLTNAQLKAATAPPAEAH
jgi:tetratricopeptide (TPR) repeat protein